MMHLIENWAKLVGICVLVFLCPSVGWACKVTISMSPPACTEPATWYECSKDFFATVTYDDFDNLNGNSPVFHMTRPSPASEYQAGMAMINKDETSATYKLTLNTFSCENTDHSYWATIAYGDNLTASSTPFSKPIHNGIEFQPGASSASIASPASNASIAVTTYYNLASTHQASWKAFNYSGGTRTRLFHGDHAASFDPTWTWASSPDWDVVIPVGIGVTSSGTKAFGESTLAILPLGLWNAYGQTQADGDNGTGGAVDATPVPYYITK